MNIANLKQGQEFKNLKELCTQLEIQYKDSTNSKKAILKEVERFAKLSRKGRRICVEEVYLIPKEKVDNRKGHSGTTKGLNAGSMKFGKYIDVLLENLLFKQKQKDDVIYITNSCIAQKIQMVNFNYRVCLANREKFHKFLYNRYFYSPYTATNDVFSCIYSKMRPAITSSLNRLQAQGKITYNVTYITYYENENTVVTDVENKKIIQLEINTLKGMEITPKKMMWNNKKRQEFYAKVNEKVKEYFYNNGKEIDGIYQGYKIFNIKNIKEQENIKTIEKEFNNIFATDVMDSIRNNNERIKQKYTHEFTGWGVPKYKKWDEERITSLKYINLVEHSINILISHNAINITQRIEAMRTNKQVEQENIAMAKEYTKLFGNG